jgi:diguanylate cyclase (GGDEF)-like protein
LIQSTIRLPIRYYRPDAPPSLTELNRSLPEFDHSSSTASSSELRLLLVEDDATYANLVEAMLESVPALRFRAVHRASARAAIERLALEHFDAVILDLGLPDTRGLEALTWLVSADPDVPIVILTGADDEMLALQAVKSGAQDYFLKGHVTPETLVRGLRYAIERKQSELQMKRLAYYDTLTGLPNRRLLIEHLNAALRRAARNESVVGVLFVDIDRFKHINDTLGHDAGDRVLQTLADRMARSLRAADMLGRLSGDEFVAIVEAKRREELSVVAGHLISGLRAPLTVAGVDVVVTASIGVSAFPADGANASELLRFADRAMYRAKAEGRDAYRFHSRRRPSDASPTLAVASELRRAVERDELLLLFQPLVDLRTGRIDGLEALVRWQHPERGLLTPADFIPVAEESGLILAVDAWVLHTAMLEAGRRSHMRSLKLAINMSRRHFDQPGLLDELRKLATATGCDPRHLELELTESGIMHDRRRVLRHLKGLRRLGIRVAIDDFGTGYSCLDLMKRYPLNALKIDRSFVRNCATDRTNGALVAAIVQMGHALGMEVIAEGVETQAQLAYLREHHCDRAQGLLFSRPLSAVELPALLDASHSD